MNLRPQRAGGYPPAVPKPSVNGGNSCSMAEAAGRQLACSWWHLRTALSPPPAPSSPGCDAEDRRVSIPGLDARPTPYRWTLVFSCPLDPFFLSRKSWSREDGGDTLCSTEAGRPALGKRHGLPGLACGPDGAASGRGRRTQVGPPAPAQALTSSSWSAAHCPPPASPRLG